MGVFTREYFQLTIIDPLLDNLSQYQEILNQLLIAVLILIVAWIAAKIIQLIVKFILRLFSWFDKLSDKTGLTKFLEHSGLHNIPSTTIANLVYWIILFLGFTLAVDQFGVPAFILVKRLIIYIPSALVSVFIIIIGVAIAILFGGLLQSGMRRAGIRENIASFFKNILFVSIIVFSIIHGLRQLRVTQQVISVIITHILQWSFIGFAVAFGLGGRHIASDIVASFKLRKLYPKGEEVEYDDVKGVLKEIGWFDSLVYTEEGIINIPNSALARKVIKRKI